MNSPVTVGDHDAGRNTGPVCILYVDDDGDATDTVRAALDDEDDRYELVATRSAPDALETLESGRVDCGLPAPATSTANCQAWLPRLRTVRPGRLDRETAAASLPRPPDGAVFGRRDTDPAVAFLHGRTEPHDLANTVVLVEGVGSPTGRTRVGPSGQFDSGDRPLVDPWVHTRTVRIDRVQPS
jgi:CheY-like chemotaxis protein